MIFSNIYKGPVAFGLDISDFSIKIAQLEKKGLKILTRTPIPKDVIKEGEIKKEDELIELLKKAVKDIKTPYAVCSLPEQHAFVKVLDLPEMKESEIKEAIKWETEANIPLSLDEVYLDWRIIPVKSNIKVLINVAPKTLVDKYLKVLRRAYIEPMVFEIESVATARSLIKKEPKPVLIIDLGFSRTSFIIFAKDSIRFTNSISISNQQMINDIAKKLNISFKEAQTLKFETGLKGDVLKTLAPFIDKMINKVEDCIDFYKEEKISKIILCGGGAYLNGLPEYFTNKLKIPADLGKPWINVKKQDILAYSTVLGLALRGVRL